MIKSDRINNIIKKITDENISEIRFNNTISEIYELKFYSENELKFIRIMNFREIISFMINENKLKLSDNKLLSYYFISELIKTNKKIYL